MKLLYLLADSSLMGGISRHVLGLVQALSENRNYETAVCTVFPRGELNAAVEQTGGKSYSLEACDFNSWHVYGRFRKVMNAFCPDLIHIHVITFWQWIYLALVARHIPTLFTVHSDYGKGTWQKRTLRHFLPLNVSRYVFVSQGVRDAYDSRRFLGEVIYNCVKETSSSERGRLQSELGLAADTPIIGTACKISAVKRPEMFVRVMIEVLTRNLSVHAVIIGDGAPTVIRELKSIIRRSTFNLQPSTSSRFHFLGYRADARELVSGLKVFVATSQREGMPTAMLEAMSAGVPVAFMRGRGGLRDLDAINDSADGPIGIVVNEGDENALAEGVNKLLTNIDYWNVCSQNAQRICREKYNFDRELEKLTELYMRTLQCAPTPKT